MRKYLFGIGFLILAFTPVTCSSMCISWLLDYQPPGVYVGAFGGIAGGYSLKSKGVVVNRGYYCGLNVGKKVFPNLRLEVDGTWQGNDVHGIKKKPVALEHVKGTINIWSGMVNAIFDFNLPFPGSPSLGGGVGYAHAHGHWSGSLTQSIDEKTTLSKTLKSSLTKSGLAWQIIADLNFFLMDDLKLNVEYRYLKLTSELNSSKFGLSLVKFF